MSIKGRKATLRSLHSLPDMSGMKCIVVTLFHPNGTAGVLGEIWNVTSESGGIGIGEKDIIL